MSSYNPQMRIEITEIIEDGTDIPLDVDFLGGMGDLTSHSGNKPLHVTAVVQKALGGAQDSCTLIVRNSAYIEQFRQNPQAELEKFRGKKLRLRVFAWWDDNNSVNRAAEPQTVVVFVGDILQGFEIKPEGITDTAIQFQALSHAWLASSGKYLNAYDTGTSYFDIAEDLMAEITERRGQGRERLGADPYFVVDDSLEKLGTKELLSPYAINGNPLEVLNKMAKEFDYMFGVNGNIPYIAPKAKPFAAGLLPVDPANSITARSIDVSFETGMASMVNYGMYEFSFDHVYTSDFIVGRVVTAFDEPQINVPSTFVAGRIDEMSITIDNYAGHSVNVHCKYLYNFNALSPTEADVTLPEKRADNNGLRSE